MSLSSGIVVDCILDDLQKLLNQKRVEFSHINVDDTILLRQTQGEIKGLEQAMNIVVEYY